MPAHDDHQLRQFLAARNAGDQAAMRRWWDELVQGNFDRVRGMVMLQSRGRLSPDEQDEAVRGAIVKVSNNMIHTFKGSSMGEWVNSAKTLVHGVCIDTQRTAARRSKRRASLHVTDAEGHEQLDHRVYEALRKEREAQEADDAEDLDRYSTVLDWAIAQLPPKQRAVIEFDRAGVEQEDIEQRLGMSRDAVYANRSRGMRALPELAERHPG